MSKGQSGFLLLFLLAIALITIGAQGNLGVTFAVLFCPGYVTLNE
jgi:uncharacterized membrane protein